MKTLRIKDICDKGSSNLKQKDVQGFDGKYPVYGASGIIGKVNDYHQDKEYIAIVKDGSGIGRVSFMPAYSSVIGTLQYILPKEGYNIKYISYCLQSLDLANFKQGAAIPHIYFRDYGEFLVNVEENIEKQQQIVSFLDSEFEKIDALKANAEKQLQAAKDLFQKALKEMLTPKDGWEEKTLDEISYDMFRGSGITREQIRNEGIACVRYGEIYTTYNYWFENCVSHTDEQIIKSPKYFEHGDILFAITGESVEDIGKSIAYLGNEKCMAGGDIVVMKHNENPTYLSYALATPDAVAQKGFGKTKLKVVHTNIPSLKTIVIPIPSLKEQQATANNLDVLSAKVKQLEKNYNETITLCNDLKQSLLKRIFE